MSALSPVRRLRTTDFSDFFRGNTPQTPQEQPKTKRTRIPFLGRSRKKSSSSASTSSRDQRGPSTSSSPLSSPDHQSVIVFNPAGDSPPERVPPRSNVHPLSSSLTSKFAARLSPSKHRPPQISTSDHSSLTLIDPDTPTASLVPPSPSPRVASFDSSSTAVQDRSTTPRPFRPTFTVSVSPPDDFEDLFTRPRQIPTSAHSDLHLLTVDSVESSDDDKLDPSEVTTPDPSPPTSPPMDLPNPSFHSANSPTLTPPLQMDDSSISDFSSDQPNRSNDIIPPKQKHHSLSVWRELELGLGTELDPDSAEDSEDHSLPESTPSPEVNSPWKRQTVATMPYKSSERPSSPRSRIKTPAYGKGLSGPPSTPLPPPPMGSPSFSSVPTIPSIPSRGTVSSSSQSRVSCRPRAHTIPSLVPTAEHGPTKGSSRPPSMKSKGKTKPKPPVKIDLDTEEFENATSEQLRQALKAQRARFDDLAACFLGIAEKHAAEKAILMKKIDTLEREARKTGRELKGLRYLVMHGTGSGVVTGLPSLSASRPPGSVESKTFDGVDSFQSNSVQQRHRLAFDVKRGYQHKSDNLIPDIPRHPTSLTVPAVSGTLTAGSDFSGSDMPYLPGVDKRSSVSSHSSSATSSTSSLLSSGLGVTTGTMTVSSALSVIPEARTPTPDSGRNRTRDSQVMAAEKQREKDERRASRALRRLSSSSTTSSTSSASIAYAANLKRGRPPSIAQVLGESSSMEDMLERLRPFGTAALPPPPSRKTSRDTLPASTST